MTAIAKRPNEKPDVAAALLVHQTAVLSALRLLTEWASRPVDSLDPAVQGQRKTAQWAGESVQRFIEDWTA